eukprot:5949847-Heterocapsa_arctica.AAC.2
MPTKFMEKLWTNIKPNYKGKVGQAVVDLGTTHRIHTRASINKGKKVADTSNVIKITQALALAVREKSRSSKQEDKVRPLTAHQWTHSLRVKSTLSEEYLQRHFGPKHMPHARPLACCWWIKES